MMSPFASLRSRDHLARWVLQGRMPKMAALALVSLGAGMAEAAFLLVVSRTAFGLTQDVSTVDLPLLGAVSTTGAASVALAIVCCRGLLATVANHATARLTADVIAHQREQVAAAYLGASWPAQQADPPGRLQELLTTYATAAGTVVSSTATVLTSALNIVALVVFAVAVEPISALAVVAVLGVLGALLRPVRTIVRRQGEAHASSGMTLATQLSEYSRLGLEFRAFNADDAIERELAATGARNHDTGRRLAALRGTVPILYTSTAYAVLAVVLLVASGGPASSITSIGPILLIMLRSLSYGQAAQSSVAALSANVPFVEGLRGAVAAYRGSPAEGGQIPLDRGARPIVFDGVGFDYGDLRVLDDISFEIAPGEKIGIVGPSGSGKSTLLQLLLGLRQPTRGTITYGDIARNDYARPDWHRHVSVVPQAPQLIVGTIEDNIRFFRADIDAPTVHAAATRAGLGDEIKQHPDGYQRQLGAGRDGLSGGQAQRLCLARALAGAPSVLVLDEPTSALDVRSELLIRESLSEIGADTTVVIVAHRMSTLDICDRIMVVRDGRLIAFDTPANLSRDNSFYRDAARLSGAGRE